MTGSPAQGEGDGGPARLRGHGPGGGAPSPLRATFLFCGRSSRVAKPLGSFEDSELLLIVTVWGPLSLFKCQVRSVSAVTPPPVLRSRPRGRVAPPAVCPRLQSPQRAAQLALRSRSLSAWTEAPGSPTPDPHSLDGEKPGPGRPALLRWGPGRCGRTGRGSAGRGRASPQLPAPLRSPPGGPRLQAASFPGSQAALPDAPRLCSAHLSSFIQKKKKKWNQCFPELFCITNLREFYNLLLSSKNKTAI